MTTSDYQQLRNAQDEDFQPLATALGFECAGPKDGAYLVRDAITEGAAWLFGPVPVAPGIFGRVCLRSVWTPLNVARMNHEPYEHLI